MRLHSFDKVHNVLVLGFLPQSKSVTISFWTRSVSIYIFFSYNQKLYRWKILWNLILNWNLMKT